MIKNNTVISKTITVLSIPALQVLFLTSLIVIAPLFKQQLITGPLVNAILFLAVVLISINNAMLVALIPSVVSLTVGLLPPALAPMIPFIMLSNVILVVTFNYLKQQNFWLGVICASSLKFLFLVATSNLVINLLLQKEVAAQVALMMSWPQLFTALAGGVVAFSILKGLKKVD